MAHARRKLNDLHAVRASPVTSEALEGVGALYRTEEDIRGKPLAERRRVRQEKAVPLLDDMKRWFETTLLTLSAKSDTTKAIQYWLNRWPGLVYYCSDGQAGIDNRDFSFAGADSGGECAAVMYGPIRSARLNGLDPEAYLHHIIDCIAGHPINRIDELPQWNVAANLSVIREGRVPAIGVVTAPLSVVSTCAAPGGTSASLQLLRRELRT